MDTTQQPQQNQQSPSSALGLAWTFGFNRDNHDCVHNLSDNRQKVLLYASAHTGVLYDWVAGRQKLLQGHCNAITSMSVSRDRRWLATADKGPNSLVIVWDLRPALGRPDAASVGTKEGGIANAAGQPGGTGANGGNGATGGNPSNTAAASSPVIYENDGTLNAMPIKTIFSPHGGHGAVTVEFTHDSKYLVTLGDEPEQSICIWNWTTPTEDPLATLRIAGEPQTCLKVNPIDTFEFMTNGSVSVNFFVWDLDTCIIEQHVPVLSSKDFKHVPSGYTHSTFIPALNQAALGTVEGDVIVWSDRSLNNLNQKLERGHKSAIKFVKLHSSAITCITTVSDKFLITGGAEGSVKVFDLNFRILFWYERLHAGPISSIAFSLTSDTMFDDVPIPELIVTTRNARIVLLHRPQGNAISPFRPGTATGMMTTVSGGGGGGLAIPPDNTSTAFTNTQAPINAASSAGTRRERNPNAEPTGVPSVTNLLHGQFQQVHSLVTHPELNRFAVGGDAGLLQIWDYSSKQLFASRQFEETPVVTTATSASAAANGDGAGDKEPTGESDLLSAKHAKQPDGQATGAFATESAAIASASGAKKASAPIAMKIRCLSYSASGKTLAVGFSNGVIRMLDASTLEDLPQSQRIRNDSFGHQISHKPIVRIAFSPDGDYCAAADADHVVCILRKEVVRVYVGSAGDKDDTRSSLGSAGSGETSSRRVRLPGDDDANNHGRTARHRIEWVFIGRRKTHYREIVSLLFPSRIPNGTEDSSVRLLSVSKDRHVASYDLSKSSLVGGIVVDTIRRIEQIHRPEAAVMYQKHHQVHPEQFVMTFNSGYKFRLYTAATQLCRKTVLAPTYGGHINNLVMIPSALESRHVAFSTTNQVIGIVRLPLNGNPFETMGILGHPGNVTCLACTHNGTHIITAGGTDGIINYWSINTNMMEAQIALGGGTESMQPFLHMLDPSGLGENGPIYREFEDYFYYAQLRSQGEDAIDSRIISDHVRLDQVPAIMQAMGFYPSNQDFDDMINEVKYSRFAQGQGEEVTSIALHDLIRLYINHRPVRDVSADEIEVALSHAKRLEPGRPLPHGPVTKLSKKHAVASQGLVALLQQFGESMSIEDARDAFTQLLLDTPQYGGQLPSRFTVKEFVEDILGFSYMNAEDDNTNVDASASAQRGHDVLPNVTTAKPLPPLTS